VHTDAFYTDQYEVYEQQFDPLRTNRRARRRRKPEPHHVPKQQLQEVVNGLTDDLGGDEIGFQTTYQPSRYEEGWLLDSVRAFYEQALIDDILARVKGGKEANVYRCEADPSTGTGLLAAKVYRPRQFRNLRNDKLYRNGRVILTADGRPVKTTDHRIMRAIGKKTTFGQQVSHTSWLMHEFVAMQQLYEAGAAVPKPYTTTDNAILMSYIGDAYVAAPTMNQVSLDPDEARVIFAEVLRNVELMLVHDMVHGDLSSYNILYWEGRITLIDFPQVTNIFTNDQAYYIFRRDVQRVCDYFALQGVVCEPSAIADELWRRYVPAMFDNHTKTPML
jgi:RIO kinase 1